MDDQLGLVTIIVVDCIGGLADWQSLTPTVTATATPGGEAIYADIGAGVITFANVPPPDTLIDVFRDGEKIATARVPIRPGAQTTVTFNYPQYL